MRYDYGDRLIIEEEVSLGDMPLKVDLLLIRRDPAVALPFPFCFPGERTLVEYKGPDDPAGPDGLCALGEAWKAGGGLPGRRSPGPGGEG